MKVCDIKARLRVAMTTEKVLTVLREPDLYKKDPPPEEVSSEFFRRGLFTEQRLRDEFINLFSTVFWSRPYGMYTNNIILD